MTLAQLDDTPRSQEHAKIAFDNQLDKLFLTPAERQFVQVAKASLSAESRNAN
jgi:hypothetical protein